jgi:hypothetical protein
VFKVGNLINICAYIKQIFIDAVVRLKDWSQPFNFTNGKKFCEDVHRPDKVQALLDFPLPDGNVPRFISYVFLCLIMDLYIYIY